MQPYNRILKRPKGLSDEAGIDFAQAVNEAAARGYTLHHLTEEWNGRFYCRLADPNSNAPSTGDSFSFGRSGDTPGMAVRAVLAQFGATPEEKEFAALIEEIRETDPMRAPVILKVETVKRLQAAIDRNVAARSAEARDDDL